jgi:hypothetical protein
MSCRRASQYRIGTLTVGTLIGALLCGPTTQNAFFGALVGTAAGLFWALCPQSRPPENCDSRFRIATLMEVTLVAALLALFATERYRLM